MSTPHDSNDDLKHQATREAKGSPKGLWIALALLVVILCAAMLLIFRGDRPKAEDLDAQPPHGVQDEE